MKIKDIKEIKEIQRIIVEPGQKSEVIKREGNCFLIIVTVQGSGVILQADHEDGGQNVNYNTAPRLDFRDGNNYRIKAWDFTIEPLVVIVYKMLMTMHI